AERLSRAQRMAVSYASRQHDRPIEEPTHRANEHEGVEPAGLTAGTRSQKNEAIGASFHRSLGVTDGGDIGKYQRADIMQRGDQRQADAITKAAKEVGGSQTRAFHWFIVPRCKFLVLASDNIGAGEDRQQKTAGGKHVRPAPRLSNRLRTNLAGAGALPLPDCLQLARRIDHLSRRR